MSHDHSSRQGGAPQAPMPGSRMVRATAPLVAVPAVAAGTLVTLLLWPWLQSSVSTMLFIPAIGLAALYGGLLSGLVAAGLSELALSLILPAADANALAIVVRLVVFSAVAVVVAFMSAQHREDLRLLEERVSTRTADLEHANQRLNAQIAERRALQRRLEYLVDHDPLTGLLNRRRFEKMLEEEVARTARYGGGGAVLLVDLDHFKDVNDTMGHQAGDQLLKTVGGILRDAVRRTDAVARLGGDEFGILLRQVDVEHATRLADALVKATRQQQLTLGRQLVTVTASVGLSMLDGSTAPQILAGADFAMYEAKKSGRDGFSSHTVATRGGRQAPRRLSEFERLRHAIDEHRFALFGQPIVDLVDSSVSQYELLLRVLDDEDRPLPPGPFLSVAERVGLISNVDAWVVREAITLLAAQQRAGRPVRLHVNISGKSVGDPALVRLIDRSLRETGADPQQLVFELTETAAIANLGEAQAFAEQLRQQGCQFALDDFGTGFGSFLYLKHIPFDYLKIDGDFIRGFMENETDALVVEAIVGIARGMSKKTVAEFVTSAAVAARLHESGVDYAQGYQLGLPQPVSELLAA